MKTKYFSERSLNDNGKDSIKGIAGFSSQKLDVLAKWFENLQDTPNIDLPSMEALGKDMGEAPVSLRKIVRVVYTLLAQMGKNNDTPADMMEDIVTLKILPSKSEQLLSFLNRLLPKTAGLYKIYKKDLVASGGVSSLNGMSIGVALKPIFNIDYVYGKDSISTYSPDVLDYVPVAQISLTKSDCSQEFSFCLPADDLNRLVSNLLAVQKQMVVAAENSKKLVK